MSKQLSSVPCLTVQPFPGGRAESLMAELQCPPDKSITHRSVMFASMAQGQSQVLSPLLGADCRSTMGVFRSLGVEIDETPTGIRVISPGWDHFCSPTMPLDFGNSGTTARLLTGLFAATPGLFVTCYGDASLSNRPMSRVVNPLRSVDASILGREQGRLLPLAIQGKQLRPGHHLVDKASAQVKSALILAGLNVEGASSVTLPGGSRDHTEKMLRGLGANIEVQVDQQRGLETITILGRFRPNPRIYRVPGDPSSAAFIAALSVLSSGSIRINGMLDNPTRTGFMTILKRFGAHIEKSEPVRDDDALEPVVNLTIRGGYDLQAVDIEPELAPTYIDEVPVLAVVALFAKGRTRLRGLSELRVKESDRLAKTIELVTKSGGKAYAEADDLIIEGPLQRAQRFDFSPDWDHRLAMAAGVLAKFADGPCQIADPDCVKVSFPGFFDVLSSLR